MSWEDDEDKGTLRKPIVKKALVDDDDDKGKIKGSWEDDDEEEEKPKPAETAKTPANPNKPKNIEKEKKKKIAQKDQQQKKEEQEREQKVENSLTAEEKYNEKVRQEKLVKASDLEVMKDAFKGVVTESGAAVPASTPLKPIENEDEAIASAKELAKQIVLLNTSKTAASAAYITFLKELMAECCAPLSDLDVKELTTKLSVVQRDKQLAAKPKAKQAAKKKGPIGVTMGKKDVFDGYGYGMRGMAVNDDDGGEDFM
eukprot:c21265_g4_i1.p1 GENE.c21265_g4_i1~~c21265_g4_i1.p1  ORF type:complete len:257 (-),score=104.47 c21265_g4_i1:74-844(-)